MSPVSRQSDTCRPHLPIPGKFLRRYCWSAPPFAGEAAIDPSDNGVDVLLDSTEDIDSRSSETSAAAAELVDPASHVNTWGRSQMRLPTPKDRQNR